jgi:hypothetical protein
MTTTLSAAVAGYVDTQTANIAIVLIARCMLPSLPDAMIKVPGSLSLHSTSPGVR